MTHIEEPRCYEPIGNGHCRNKPYQTIGIKINKSRHELNERPPPKPHDMRCKKHWEEWRTTLFDFLYGTDHQKWFTQ